MRRSFIPPVHYILLFLALSTLVVLPLVVMVGGTLCSREGVISFQETLFSLRPWKLFYRTVTISLAVSFITTFLGLITALYFEVSRSRIARFAAFGNLTPLLIPPYLHAIAWIDFIGGGIFKPTNWEDVSAFSQSFFSIYGMGGVIIIISFAYYPIATEVIRAGLRSLDSSYWEAALLQQSPSYVFRKIILALIKPFVLGTGLITFILALGEYGVPSLLSINTYPVEIFSRFSAFYDERAAVSACLPLSFIGLGSVLLLTRIMRNRPYMSFQRKTGQLCLLAPEILKKVLGIVTVLLILVAGLIPIGALIYTMSSAPILKSLSVASNAIHYSSVTSVIGTVCIMLLVIPSAYYVQFGIPRFRSIFRTLSIMPLAFPATAYAIGLIYLWNTNVTAIIYRNTPIIILLLVGTYLPYAFIIVSAAFRQINRQFLDAASLVSGSPYRRWKCIVMPLMKKGLNVTFITILIFCFRELSGTLLVIPPGKETVSIRIYSLMHYGALDMVATLGIFQLLITVVLGFFCLVTFNFTVFAFPGRKK